MSHAASTPHLPADLAALLSRVALGDRAAFSQLYQASSAYLFGVILRINTDRGQAEEVLQETYVNVWKAAQSFDAHRGQAMTWLISLARHRAIDSLRRRQSEPLTQSATTDEDSDDFGLIPSPLPGPLQLLQAAAEVRELTQCVGQLSAQQQQCVALMYYQGLSHAEVAQNLAAPLGSVKSWIRRALSSLKGCLERAAHTFSAEH